jgi:NAD(P)-dependent dehydrogenase (short-subunit alcohol dehydrogenase family)
MVQPTFDFDDQVVVVTGGSRGVGAGIVTAFLDAGANVVTCGRHEAEVDGAVFVAADVRKPAEAERVIARRSSSGAGSTCWSTTPAGRPRHWRPSRRHASSSRW